MAVVVDDRLLLDCLAALPPQSVATELVEGEVLTTAAWYFRLGRAAFAGTGIGALSRRLQQFDLDTRQQVRSALGVLPPNISLLDSKDVVPVMFTLQVRRQTNFLAAEALAVSVVTQARIVVTTDNPLIRAGADELGLDYEVLA